MEYIKTRLKPFMQNVCFKWTQQSQSKYMCMWRCKEQQANKTTLEF